MTFFRFLQGIGDRLGILESVANPESTPATRIETKSVSLQELAQEIRSGEVKALADSSAELAMPFEKIYEAAGISLSPEEWSLDRLKQVIEREMDLKKTREDVQKAVLDLLKSEGISAEILVKDAIARDRALDAFEASVCDKMKNRDQSCRRRLLEIENQIKSLKDESSRISENLRADEEKWRQWRKDKRSQERELASIAGYLVDQQVVTTEEEEIGH
jgi:hypothetical protein